MLTAHNGNKTNELVQYELVVVLQSELLRVSVTVLPPAKVLCPGPFPEEGGIQVGLQ